MNLKAETIMTQNVVALQPNDTLATAMQEMRKKRIRHMPVVNKKGEFVGLLSHRDLLAASASLLAKDFSERQRNILESTLVGKVMHKGAKTTTPTADLRDVARMMVKHKVGCLPVLNGKVLAGIITASDFLSLSINLLSMTEMLEKNLSVCRIQVGAKK